MPDYKKLYFELFNKVSDIIEELKEVQIKAEEIFLEEDDDEQYKKTSIWGSFILFSSVCPDTCEADYKQEQGKNYHYFLRHMSAYVNISRTVCAADYAYGVHFMILKKHGAHIYHKHNKGGQSQSNKNRTPCLSFSVSNFRHLHIQAFKLFSKLLNTVGRFFVYRFTEYLTYRHFEHLGYFYKHFRIGHRQTILPF